MSEYDRERYAWYKQHGICVDCGTNEAYKGYTRCLECRFKGTQKTQKYQARNREKNAEYQRQYQRELRAYRKEHGLCQQCGKPTNNGYVFCTEHLAARRKKAENRRREQGIIPIYLMGKGEYCWFCGKKVANYGDKTCPECYQRECEWAAEMRKRIDYKAHIWRKLNDASFAKYQAEKRKEIETSD